MGGEVVCNDMHIGGSHYTACNVAQAVAAAEEAHVSVPVMMNSPKQPTQQALTGDVAETAVHISSNKLAAKG